MVIHWSIFHTPYSSERIKKYVPSGPGVYILWVRYKDGKWACSYVGRADNLEKQLLDHLGDSEPNKCIKDNVKYTSGFHYAEVASKSGREGVEKFLIDTYSSECNESDPGGFPIPVDLPAKPSA